MKKSRLYPFLVAILIVSFVAPAFGYVDPWQHGNQIWLDADGHPWGGELRSTYDPNIGNGGVQGTMTYIGTPLSFLNFFRFIPFLNIRNNITIIRGNILTSGNYSPSPTVTIPNSPSGTTTRGN